MFYSDLITKEELYVEYDSRVVRVGVADRHLAPFLYFPHRPTFLLSHFTYPKTTYISVPDTRLISVYFVVVESCYLGNTFAASRTNLGNLLLTSAQAKCHDISQQCIVTIRGHLRESL